MLITLASPCGKKQQRGISLIMSMFILVVMSLLGAAMINIMAGGGDSVAREVISTRALFAAESGAQRMLNNIFVRDGTVNPDNCFSQPLVFSGLEGCAAVEVDCSYVIVNNINFYSISSTGSCGPVAEPAVRVVEVQAKDVN